MHIWLELQCPVVINQVCIGNFVKTWNPFATPRGTKMPLKHRSRFGGIPKVSPSRRSTQVPENLPSSATEMYLSQGSACSHARHSHERMKCYFATCLPQRSFLKTKRKASSLLEVFLEPTTVVPNELEYQTPSNLDRFNLAGC